MKAPLAGPRRQRSSTCSNATDYITPALEILDTRIVRVDPETKKARTIFDTISDNAANAGIVLGGRRAGPREADMRWMGAIVSRNGEVEETGLGAGVLNHPARGIAWLANRLHQYGSRSRPARWCCRARSCGPSRRATATPSLPISARSERSIFSLRLMTSVPKEKGRARMPGQK